MIGQSLESVLNDLHPHADTLALQPKNVLGEGIATICVMAHPSCCYHLVLSDLECLSMAQLLVLEEIHHRQLMMISECRERLARRQERALQREKAVLSLQLLLHQAQDNQADK